MNVHKGHFWQICSLVLPCHALYLSVEPIWKRRDVVHALGHPDLVSLPLLPLPVGAGHLSDDGRHLVTSLLTIVHYALL